MGLFMTDMVIGSFSLNKCMYQIQGVMMDLYGTYDGILGLNFFAQHGLLTDTNSLAYLLEAGGADLSALGLQKEDMSNLNSYLDKDLYDGIDHITKALWQSHKGCKEYSKNRHKGHE